MCDFLGLLHIGRISSSSIFSERRSINNIGRVINEEIAPPHISEEKRQNQTRHQQQ